MQYHDAYRELNETELKSIPNKYWIDDLPLTKKYNTEMYKRVVLAFPHNRP